MSSDSKLDRNVEESQLTAYIIDQVVGRASGTIANVSNECWYNPPRDVYFIGSIRPRPDDPGDLLNEPTYLGELLNKLAPIAFGGDFNSIPEGDAPRVSVTLEWNCYYRVFPTYAQQVEHQRRQIVQSQEQSEESKNTPNPAPKLGEMTITDTDNDAEDSLEFEQLEKEEERIDQESPEATQTRKDRSKSRQSKDSLFIRFRRIACRAQGKIILKLEGSEWKADWSDLQEALDAETSRASQVASADAELIRGEIDARSEVTVPESVLESEKSFTDFLKSLRTSIIPEWQWEIRVETRSSEDDGNVGLLLGLEFVNTSPLKSRPPARGSSRVRDNSNIEPFFFDTKASFQFEDLTIVPFELELAPRGFRYNRELWGRGFNCAIQGNANANRFITTHTPISLQRRYLTRTKPSATFEDLAQDDPLKTLDGITSAMDQYLANWAAARQAYVDADQTWEVQFGERFDNDRTQFETEIARFRRGCELIRENDDVRLAFKLTNEAFRRVGQHPNLPANKRKSSWRLFQIVFLVSQIPGIAAIGNPNSSDEADLEQVDIIYFPTGGGKTEAYLAVLVFHCFFDRLRGKSAGVTAWIRFPLRLLTLQQTQRTADVIGVAELVRREQPDPRLAGKDIAGFAVAYFVGKEATPNEIINADQYQYAKAEDSVTWSQANDPKARTEWKRLITCPACRTPTVRVDFDVNSCRVIHRCTQQACAFNNGKLPVYVVDNEIYRYLPTVIVGTIDKLASLGNQRKLAQVFGQVDGKCDRHGYYKGKCAQKDCRNDSWLKKDKPRGVSGPTLFIQDELHLLKEGLGTFDGHYETFTQELRTRFGQSQPLKIIASSATIEAFERQVEHLYGRRRARVFPGLGPTLPESFYAETQNYPQRAYVAILPHNKTIFNSILELIELYHRTIQDLQKLCAGVPNPFGGSTLPGTNDWFDLLDPYVTSLTYFLANRELDSIRTDLKGDVIPNLERDGYLPIEPQDLTGGTSTEEVTRVLERLETSSKPFSPADAVLATNMISHGVDVDRLNAMIFYGMPRQTAEYIQASSRVGRSHVGIVFVCLHPARERDQSHYTYFSKYHEFIGQLIEPVAINRWAKFSLKRTVPGLFMAVLLQQLSNDGAEARNGGKYYMREFVRQKIANGTIRADQFTQLLEKAYLVSAPSTIGEQDFRAEINRRVRMFLDQIQTAGAGTKFVSDALIPKPMISLRDVDETLVIELDTN